MKSICSCGRDFVIQPKGQKLVEYLSRAAIPNWDEPSRYRKVGLLYITLTAELSNVKRIEKLNKQIIKNQIKDNIMKETLDTLV